MNLLCPNCQKMLTVPEEFAGQLMKCPLCGGTFTVPGLPGAAPPPSPPAPAADVYPVRPEPPPSAPPSSPPPPSLPEPPPPSSVTTSPKPSTPVPSLSSLPTEGYQHTRTLWFSPRVLPWIAPVCLLLVFVLQFFAWVGLYQGGIPAVTGNAWQSAFGAYTVDGDMKAVDPTIEDEKQKPGWSLLTLFYLLLFFPVLLVTVASVAVGMVQFPLPPQVQKLLPWRWGIVAAANLLLFLFLALQVALGFSLEAQYTEWVDKTMKPDTKQTPPTQQKKEDDAKRGELLQRLAHTFWLRLVIVLHLVAIVSAALMFWIAQRGPNRPMPRLELSW